ncbi:MAG TPA: hypothetical protein VNE39_29095 [Planctomycetota bacterium]|nr:hypothetical protein [Planctomycetota bacterium]
MSRLAAILALALMWPAAAEESPNAAAEGLLAAAQANRLSPEQLALAAGLLKHADPFVRGMADWAIAMKVGLDNNGQQAVWPRANPPEWFQVWQSLSPTLALEADWVRQAVSLGIHRDGARLLASVDAMLARAGRMAADFGPQAGSLRRPPAHRLEACATNPDGGTGILPGAEPHGGTGILPVLGHLDALRAARAKLAEGLKAAPADLAAHRTLWLEARRHGRAIALANPALDFDQVVFLKQFAPHTVRNITRSYPWKHKPGGGVCVLSALRPDAPVRDVIQGRLGPGYVWGLDLWWDADRVVFAYARQPNWPPHVNTALHDAEGSHALELRKRHEPLHLFEARLDGSSIRQITDDRFWGDFEPTYCANGDVVFASDRCGRSPECGSFHHDHANPNLYIVAPDGSNLRRLTDSRDVDRYPHSLDNGLIAYTHWEYQERHFMEVHAIWTLRPDGSQSDTLFKHHMKAPLALRDTRSVPGTQKLVATAAGHHTFAYGPVVVVDPRRGMNTPDAVTILTPGVKPQEGPTAGRVAPEGGVADAGGLYQTPWALSDSCFLAAYAYARPKCTAPAGADSNGFAIYLIDAYGNKELLHRDPVLSCTFPIPLRKRPRPPVVPSVIEEPKGIAACFVNDVYQGLGDVPRGTIKSIRISQHVGWPLDAERGAQPYLPSNAYAKQYGYWSWSPVRVLGTVPVESDGSAHFEVPADVALYFQALDERGMEVRRMRSMVGLKAGEVRGCIGCHESRAAAPPVGAAPLALQRPPQPPTPPPWGAEKLLGYEWLVQPVLDRQCVRCHDSKDAKGLDLTATRTDGGFYRSFRTLFPEGKGKRPLVAVADRFGDAAVTQPRQFGSHRSPFIRVLDDDLHKKEVKLSEAEWLALVTWVDANAPYHDAFFNKRPTGGEKPRREATAMNAQGRLP